jgi:hypothetical protein
MLISLTGVDYPIYPGRNVELHSRASHVMVICNLTFSRQPERPDFGRRETLRLMDEADSVC